MGKEREEGWKREKGENLNETKTYSRSIGTFASLSRTESTGSGSWWGNGPSMLLSNST